MAPGTVGQPNGLSGALSGLSDQLGQSLSAMPFTNAGAQTPGDISRPSLNPLLAGNGVGRGKDPKWDVAAAIFDRVHERVSGSGTYTGPALHAGGNRVLQVAQSFLGVPYVFGALDPPGGGSSGVDCSGLTRYVFGKLGIDLPHSAAQQSQMFPRIDPSNHRAFTEGTLIFYDYGRLGGASDHVAISLGNGQQIAASSGAGEVTVQPIDWSHVIWGGQTSFGESARRRNTPSRRNEQRPARNRRRNPQQR